MKRQATEWEKISAKHIADKGYISKIYKFFKRFYLIVKERKGVHKQGERQKQQQAPPSARSPMQDLIPGHWDHDRAEGRCLMDLATQASLKYTKNP